MKLRCDWCSRKTDAIKLKNQHNLMCTKCEKRKYGKSARKNESTRSAN